MGSICGIYYYDGRMVAPETGAALLRELGVYQADVTGDWRERQVFFGCRVQHITPESLGEVLPYHDHLAGLTITADAIVDNRAELCDKLGIEHSRRGELPDSRLILQAYRKWGRDCPNYLVGDFAFAVWDAKQKELFCAVDHTGTRAFYYYFSAGLFAFSTLIRPLFVLPGIAREHDETWFADFLAIPSVMHQLDPELTPYKNIRLLPAGHTLTVRPGGAAKQVYWQVARQPELKLNSDVDYDEAFLEVLGQAVRCRLRSTRPVGVMMSGGLDSTTVACLAARELAKSGRRLQAFSAVPAPGYRDWLPAGSLADETPYINAVIEQYENIDVTYCNSAGKHALSDTGRLLAMLEQPYKTIENTFWIDSILAAAQERNIGVVLHGGAGNVTISWGDFPPYLLSLLRAGQWRRFYRESRAVARRCRQPHRALLILFRSLLPGSLQKILNRLENSNWGKDIQDLSPISPDFARQAAVRERFRRFGYDPLLINRMDSLETRLKHLRPDYFSHLGVITTKQCLAYRTALRDPTMDKRVIEFCLSLPENQYVRNGWDRFLIRRAMTGILPDMVRQNATVRGKQNADMAQRLQPCWPELAAEIKNIGMLEAEQKYLDVARIQEKLAKYSVINDNMSDDSGLRMLVRSLIFSRFLKLEESRAH